MGSSAFLLKNILKISAKLGSLEFVKKNKPEKNIKVTLS